MKPKIFVGAFLLIVLSAAFTVFAAGDELADVKKEEPPAIDLSFIQEFVSRYQQILAKFNPMRFKNENIKIRAIDADKLIEFYLRARQPSSTATDSKTKILNKLGLFPAGLDYSESLLQMYGAASNGFYDPEANEICLATKITPEGITAINQLSYEKRKKKVDDEWSATLIHELIHALQYQNSGIFARKVNNDVDLAIRSLSEGEAGLASYYYTLEYSDRSIHTSGGKPGVSFRQGSFGSNLPSGNSIDLNEQDAVEQKNLVKYYLSSIASQVSRIWDDADIPQTQYLWRTVMFPYYKGLKFTQKIQSSGNWDAISKLYINPPLSTEQIIHPEKYNKDFPQRVKLPGLSEIMGDKWRLGGQEIIGQLGVELLFREFLPKDDPTIPSEGWDGDTCALFENPETGQSFLAWYFVWDWYLHANEFYNFYKKVIGVKYKYAVTMESIDGNILWSDGETVKMAKETLAQLFKNKLLAAYRIKDTGNVVWLEKRNDTLLLLEDIPEELMEAVREKLWKSTDKKEVRAVEEYLK